MVQIIYILFAPMVTYIFEPTPKVETLGIGFEGLKIIEKFVTEDLKKMMSY